MKIFINSLYSFVELYIVPSKSRYIFIIITSFYKYICYFYCIKLFIKCQYFYYLLYFDMFRSIPILDNDTSRLEPPYDRNGSVTPVTGIKPTTTIRFKIV